MNRVLFVAINSRYSHTNLALLYLQKISREAVSSDILEFTIAQSPYDILAEIVKHKPQVVSFSVYLWNSAAVKAVISDLKKVLPGCKIVLGGPEVTYTCEEWLRDFPEIDYLVAGPGEKSWLALLHSGFNYSQQIVRIPNIPLSEIPFPYDEETIRRLEERILYYESSRGCPYRCSYCLSSGSEDQPEYRGIERVIEELDFFIVHKVSLVKFVDRTFNANIEYAKQIWLHLIKRKGETRFHFEINPLLITDEVIELLKEAPKGLFQFEIGIQSVHSRTLKEIDRQGEWHSMKNNIDSLIKNTSIPIHLDLIFGLPHDTYENARLSFDEVYKLKPAYFQPGMLKVLPGTVMAEKSQQYEMVSQKEAPYTVLGNKWISFEELIRLKRIEHLVNNLYNTEKFASTLDSLEEIEESPFKMFEELSEYWEYKEINPWQKDWIKNALLIMDLCTEKHPHATEIILDCLRWDLCCGSGLQYYPDFLLTDTIAKAFKRWRLLLKEKSEEFCRRYGTDKKQLLRAMIFRASSTEFKEKYRHEENDFFLFIKSGAEQQVIREADFLRL